MPHKVSCTSLTQVAWMGITSTLVFARFVRKPPTVLVAVTVSFCALLLGSITHNRSGKSIKAQLVYMVLHAQKDHTALSVLAPLYHALLEHTATNQK